MTTLIFTLIVPLERYDLEKHGRPHGPIFHRWLPDGEKDSILIKTKSRNLKIFVWFERCGFIQDGWIRFDYKKREIDTTILKRQAKLDAGPLRVRIELKGITTEDIKTLKENKKGDENYRRIGKRLIKILNESVIPFIDTLRFYYGQYWLQELKKWNSKDESLGSYFRGIYTKFSTDQGATWDDFIPDEIKRTLRLVSTIQSDFSSYFSKEDWKALDNIDLSEFKPTLAVKLLQIAHQLKDEGDYKQAIIEGNTSLEVAISDLFKNRLSLSKVLKKEMESFWQLQIRAQLTVISSLIEGLSHKDIENAISIVKIRNNILHEGFSPKDDFDIRKKLDSLFTIIAKLISNKPIKFPSASTANTLFPDDKQENK
jgi:hypothetical protein